MEDQQLDPRLDLMVECEVAVSPAVAWAAWTDPEHLRHWYAPAPGTITKCEIDLRVGGIFRFVIDSSQDEHATTCCYLVVEPCRRLVWTDALRPGFRPAPSAFFTAVMTLEPRDGTTLCRTVAMHRDQEDGARHADLGFHHGWGTVLDQLAGYVTATPPHLD